MQSTYGDVRRAYSGLMALVRGSIADEKVKFPIKTILKIKRMMGVMRPLVEDAEQLESKILEDHGVDRRVSGPVPNAVSKELRELSHTPVEVGTDKLLLQDLGDAAEWSPIMAGFLHDLGDFFEE